jgi:hypothetical protein
LSELTVDWKLAKFMLVVASSVASFVASAAVMEKSTFHASPSLLLRKSLRRLD